MNAVARLRSVLFSDTEPPFYWQLWLTSVNLVGVVVLSAVLLDLRVVLGPEGPRGIYQRSLYPLFPAALTMGAALVERHPRRVLLSGGALAGYVGLLFVVGVGADLLGPGLPFAVAGTTGCVVFAALGGVLARGASTA
jgi:hypothetical protein